jgi:hypothetical protein
MDKFIVSLTDYRSWREQRLTIAMLRVLEEKKSDLLRILSAMNLQRTSEEIALQVAELNGSIRVIDLLLDAERLKVILRRVLTWEEELKDGKKSFIQLNND